MDNIAECLALNIRQRRKAKGLTQEQLAEAVELSLAAIQHIESGRRWPGIENVRKIAEKLGCSEVDLFRTDQPPTEPVSPTIEGMAKLLADQEKRIKALTPSVAAHPLRARIELLLNDVRPEHRDEVFKRVEDLLDGYVMAREKLDAEQKQGVKPGKSDGHATPKKKRA